MPGVAAVEGHAIGALKALGELVERVMQILINTLSFAYHSVLWLFLGLVGAWYSAVRHHMPELEIKMRFPDLVAVSVLVFGYAFVALPIFLKMKGML